jgi:signal transduction histidine kinase
VILKLNRKIQIQLASIAQGLIVTLAVVLTWTLILFFFALSRSKTEVNNYSIAQMGQIETALVEGNILHIHIILKGLEKFGVESSALVTNIFLGKQPRTVRTGRLDRTFASQKYFLSLQNNGLHLADLHFRINLVQILKRVLFSDWKLIFFIWTSHLITFIALNYIFLNKARNLRHALAASIRTGNPNNAMPSSNSFLGRLIFSKDFENQVLNISAELASLRRTEIEISKMRNEKLIARQVAHDIRSPLTAINISLGRLTGPKEAIELLRFATDRINSIAADLLKKSRTTNPTEQLLDYINPNTLEHIAPKVVEKFEGLIHETKVRFPEASVLLDYSKFSLESTIFADLEILLRVCTIIINNSIEAFKSNHSQVAVTLSSNFESLIIHIDDTGPGISADLLSRLGKEELQSSKSDGNGIGLNYAFRAISVMAGELDIISTLGIGTKVTIALPLKNKLTARKNILL